MSTPDTEKLPRCPFCRYRHTRRSGYATFFCPDCKREFDKGGIDEGGDYSDYNAAVRIEREERWKERTRR